jgi:hypothetical protein
MGGRSSSRRAGGAVREGRVARNARTAGRGWAASKEPPKKRPEEGKRK